MLGTHAWFNFYVLLNNCIHSFTVIFFFFNVIGSWIIFLAFFFFWIYLERNKGFTMFWWIFIGLSYSIQHWTSTWEALHRSWVVAIYHCGWWTRVVKCHVLHGVGHCIISHRLLGRPHIVYVNVTTIDGVIMLIVDRYSLPKISTKWARTFC